MKQFLHATNYFLIALVVFIFGVYLRSVGLNWDANQHLHPDERFLTTVTIDTTWPATFQQYLDPTYSTLSPYNAGYDFYVYGMLPMTIGKYYQDVITLDSFDYHNATLVGRLLSVVLESFILIFVYKIGLLVTKKKQVAVLAMFFYAVSVLPIQLAHFYAVDTFLVFFLTGSFYFLTKIFGGKSLFSSTVLAGLFMGAALASKVSALLFAPFALLFFLVLLIKEKRGVYLLHMLLFVATALFVFRVADPKTFATGNIYDFTLSSQFKENIAQLNSFNSPDAQFPPAIQWITTKPLIYPFKNLILWGLGIPLGVICVLGLLWRIKEHLRSTVSLLTKPLQTIRSFSYQDLAQLIMLAWVLFLFFYQGIQFSKNMRYFYPLYPYLSIIAGMGAYAAYTYLKKIHHHSAKAFLFILIGSTVLWPLSFVSIYRKPHSRIAASQWIYDQIPQGSILTCEHWDDCLPLNLSVGSPREYQTQILELFNEDTHAKWQTINTQLASADYIIMSSNRLWATIPTVPERYPLTSQYYQNLFEEKLGFERVATFSSFPTIPFTTIAIDDSSADESFTVYDHPQVIVFKKKAL